MSQAQANAEIRPVSVSKATKLFDSQPSLQTVLRWCVHGVRRRSDGAKIKLDSHMEGGRRFIHPDAVARFIAECNGGTSPTVATSPGSNASELLAKMGL